MKINEMYIPIGHPNRPGGKLLEMLSFVIHYTANDSPTATDTNNAKYVDRQYKKIGNDYFESDGKTKFRYGSAHVFVDEDSVTRTIPYTEPSYGCGDRQLPYDNGYRGQTKLAHEVFGYRQNYLTINIEICNNGDWEKSCNNAIEEIVYIIRTYKYPAIFFRHFDITGKNCPAPFIDEKKWSEFKNKIYAKLQPVKEVDNVDAKEVELVRSLAVIIERLATNQPIAEQIKYVKVKFNEYLVDGGK